MTKISKNCHENYPKKRKIWIQQYSIMSHTRITNTEYENFFYTFHIYFFVINPIKKDLNSTTNNNTLQKKKRSITNQKRQDYLRWRHVYKFILSGRRLRMTYNLFFYKNIKLYAMTPIVLIFLRFKPMFFVSPKNSCIVFIFILWKKFPFYILSLVEFYKFPQIDFP